MYMSRIQVKSDKELFALAKKDEGQALYAAHQLLWKAFPPDADANRDFIFRREDANGLPRFFVVSKREPSNHELFQIATKEYNPQLSVETRLGFTVMANPVVARKREGSKHSAKHDVWMDAKREAKAMDVPPEKMRGHCEKRIKQWLVEKAESLGFRVSEESITIDAYQQHRLHKAKKGAPVTFSSVNYAGVLTVTEPTIFQSTLFNGIGRSRSLGCGLMLVRRV